MDRYFEIFTNAIGPILKGMFTVTIPLSVISCSLGLLLAFLFILTRYSSWRILSLLSQALVWVTRGVPLLVVLYFLFFGLAEFDLILSSWGVAIIAYSLHQGAYMSESIRGVLEGVETGQWEAGLALGLSKWTVFRKIIVPQAIPTVIPTLIGYFITAIKMTALVSNIALSDMLLAGKQFIDYYYAPFLIYGMLAILYLLMFWVLTGIQNRAIRYFSNSQRTSNMAKFLAA